MRKILLVSVAAAALAAGSATAQPNHGPAGPAAGPAQGASPAQGAPADLQATPDHGQKGHPGPAKGAREKSAQQPTKGTGTAQQQQPTKGIGTAQGTDTQMHRQPGTGVAAEHPSGATQHEHPSGVTQQGNAPGHQATGERPMTSRSVSLSTEQKTTIRQKVLTANAPRVQGHVNFDIRVGVVVPRTVRIAPVPVTLVEIEPQWRGYMYFVSGDEIIVVEPGSLRIVAVLDV